MSGSDGHGLAGRDAIVTGGGRGLGRAMTLGLAQAGVRVVATAARELAEVEAVAREAERACGDDRVRPLLADVTRAEDCAAVVRAALVRFGRLDILVNDAAYNIAIPFSDLDSLTLEVWEKVMDVNLTGPMRLIKAVAPVMKAQGGGRIVNIASAHGLTASPFKSAYVAAKHGVVGLTKVTALETAGQGITCNAICPGWTQTPLSEKQIDDHARAVGRDRTEVAREMLAEKQPSVQYVLPEQLGAAAVFLASAAAAQMTGAQMTIDGGWTAR